MSGTVILIIVIIATVLIGRFAIREGHRVEQHKKFMKNMRDHDKRYKTR